MTDFENLVSFIDTRSISNISSFEEMENMMSYIVEMLRDIFTQDKSVLYVKRHLLTGLGNCVDDSVERYQASDDRNYFFVDVKLYSYLSQFKDFINGSKRLNYFHEDEFKRLYLQFKHRALELTE